VSASIAKGAAPPTPTIPEAAPPPVKVIGPAPSPPKKFKMEMSVGRHLRAVVFLIILTLLVAGLGYPAAITGFAQLVEPGTANGSLVYSPNGTLVGSELIAQNFSAPGLFWERPSGSDYNILNGSDSPPGPTDPALAALINETIAWMERYGNYTVNAPLPLDYVGQSFSGVDPDLTPAAALIQVPRVAHFTNFTIGQLTALVNGQIVSPTIYDFGVAYVNVLNLDIALLTMEGNWPCTHTC
jgi:potassium-transporting ATPase KdpC subunit